MRIALCDDSPTFLHNAADLIKKWCDESDIQAEIVLCGNGDELLAQQKRLDAVFLDIIMPLFNGMETARELRQRDTAVRIVFLTSSPEFAIESYDVGASGYLLKPVSYEKIKYILDKCAKEIYTEKENIVVKTAFGYQKIFLSDIEYAEAQNKKVIFFLKDGRSIDTMQPLHSFEDKFTEGFFKCHRSYLVNLSNVDHFNSSEITTLSGHRIPIARGFAKPFKDAYFALMFKE